MNKIIIQDKDESKLVAWVQSACSKDDTRPTLTGISVQDNRMIGCDGHRLHMTPITSSLERFKGKIIKLLSKMGVNKLVEVEEVEGKYPDIDVVFPTGEPSLRIAVDAKYLTEALSLVAKDKDNFDRRVVLDFYSDTQPIIVKIGDYKALVMAMYLNEDEKLIDKED